MRCRLVVLSLVSLLTVVVTGMGATLYVSPVSPNPVAPYSTWLTAAQTIQDAVNAAADHDEVVVTNGLYDTGGVALFETLTNRVAVTKPIVLRSVNGPDFTFIQGQIQPTAIRCVSLADGAILSGFTLTNGSAVGSSDPRAFGGGGVWCATPNAIVTNCLLTGNQAPGGGGASGGTLYNCTLVTNSRQEWGNEGGGAWHTYLRNCKIRDNRATRGGGVFQCTLYDCEVDHNLATADEAWGGGAYQSALYNCVLSSNYTMAFGSWAGGAYESILSNCVLVGNSAVTGGGALSSQLSHCTILTNYADDEGGGAAGGSLVDCVLRGNSAGFGWDSSGAAFSSGAGGGAARANLTNCVLVGNAAGAYGGAVSSGTLSQLHFDWQLGWVVRGRGGRLHRLQLHHYQQRGHLIPCLRFRSYSGRRRR